MKLSNVTFSVFLKLHRFNFCSIKLNILNSYIKELLDKSVSNYCVLFLINAKHVDLEESEFCFLNICLKHVKLYES